MPDLIVKIGVFLAFFAGMEAAAWSTHKYVMHGWLWSLHRDHHEPHDKTFERNDLFALFFAIPSITLFVIGWRAFPIASWAGAGILAYGIVYFVFHDVIVHKRMKIGMQSKNGYLKRIIQAHRLHHAVRTKEGGLSFGFLLAPEPRRLKAELQARGLTGKAAEAEPV